ncbi:heparinase II/III domain-containing protein [Citrobacter youngae]|uniref:Heparinase II/III-like protein n=1 Tax=Citrobacter youngae ATCC 29220 TaxID=500640 RepID=D4BJ34_9ENTR|nr:heparinase II/III family protein [Citrobacter youngae]EFE06428.1 heparinase II/III-like protein [Citrobacter youngae ATCC 29220]
MKQFTQSQILQARERVTPEMIEVLIANNRDVISNPILVPETGCATWNHYFFCPEHSVRLIWDRHSPEVHRCPIDNAHFSGEPYDGAWWRWLNGLNAKACYELAILWLLTDEVQYLSKVRDILMLYAKYYPDYQEHGGIPYNGPGKANAQTLCEANCHTDFARGFDIIRAQLTLEEDRYIAERLLRVGADFLMQHRCAQIHNHEVKINSAIGIIGAVLDDKTYLEFAVNSQYGLQYQLEHALMPDGLWFEGSLHYHFYALQGFFSYEKVASGSGYSLLESTWYPKMLSVPLTQLMPDMTLAKINDCVNGQEKLTHTDIYEFAWWYYGTPEYGQLLKQIYSQHPRNSIDALFYGKPLPSLSLLPPPETLHTPESGLTIIRNKPGRAICIKHTPYGGEHDHYDRLGLTVFNNGRAIFPDLGTTGYGAPLHYGYYKNSFSHNTLCINGKNQAPANPYVVSYNKEHDTVRLITEVEWKSEQIFPDSKTRVEWDEDAYKDVVFRRSITAKDDLLIDICTIDNPHEQEINTSYLINAEPRDAEYCNSLFPHIMAVDAVNLHTPVKLRWQSPDKFTLYCLSAGNSVLFQGKGPNNPSTSELTYLTMRSKEKRVIHITVTDLSGDDDILMKIENDCLIVTVNGVAAHCIPLGQEMS